MYYGNTMICVCMQKDWGHTVEFYFISWFFQVYWDIVLLSHFSCVGLFVTLWSVACQASLYMGILQAKVLEWVAMPSSRGASRPRDQTQVSCSSCSVGGFCTAYWDIVDICLSLRHKTWWFDTDTQYKTTTTLRLVHTSIPYNITTCVSVWW